MRLAAIRSMVFVPCGRIGDRPRRNVVGQFVGQPADEACRRRERRCDVIRVISEGAAEPEKSAQQFKVPGRSGTFVRGFCHQSVTQQLPLKNSLWCVTFIREMYQTPSIRVYSSL